MLDERGKTFSVGSALAGGSGQRVRLFRSEGPAAHERVNELSDGELLAPGRTDDVVRQVLVGESEGAAQGVLDQVFGEAAGKVVFSFDDAITKVLVSAIGVSRERLKNSF